MRHWWIVKRRCCHGSDVCSQWQLQLQQQAPPSPQSTTAAATAASMRSPSFVTTHLWRSAIWPATVIVSVLFEVVFLLDTVVFTPTWLRYVRVFAIANPSVVCLSVTFVHLTQGVEAFGNISLPLCTLAILWPSCKLLRRLSQGKLSVRGVKRKRGSKRERFLTYRRLYLINGARYGLVKTND